MAGSSARLAVPGPSGRLRNPGAPSQTAGSGVATPTSTTITDAPAARARTLIAAPPPTKLATIWAVTSCGQGVTPSATTPWSATNTATAAGDGTGGGHTPVIPARCT